MKELKVIYEPLMRMMFLYSDVEDEKEWMKQYEAVTGEKQEKNGAGGRFVGLHHTKMYSCALGLIWCPNSTPDVVAHETMHAVRWYLEDRREIPLSEPTEELYAYMQQFLVKEIYSNSRAGGVRLRRELTNEKAQWVKVSKEKPKPKRRAKKK